MKYPGGLHSHTDYSNLRLRDSIATIKESIDYAIKLGHEVIAFTEHDTVANAIKIEKYYKEIKQKHPDFKVIRGNEIYLVRNDLAPDNITPDDSFTHFILLAKDLKGHQQIRELSTRAWNRSYVYKNMRRVPTYYRDIEEIIGADPGHVVASTACLGGALPKNLLRYKQTQDNDLYEALLNWCLKMQSIFGEENFYLELQPSASEEQSYVNAELVKISNRLHIPFIVTTDSHYIKKSDARIHEAYLNAQNGEREVKSFYATTYMMSDEEIRSYLSIDISEEDIEKAFENIRRIADSCADYSLLKPLKIPSLVWKKPTISTIDTFYYNKIPYLKTFMESSFDGDKILALTIVERVMQDATLQNEETYKELNNNLEMTWVSSEVNNAHWSAYFLNLQKIVDTCWEAGSLVGCGRGSGVGFLLLYILGVTQINPLRETTQTFAWRFLNPSRVSVLDVDIDVSGLRRADVLNAFRNNYGQERVANVVTFGSEKPKSAILTAARGLGIDNDVAQYLASMVPSDRGIPRTLKQCFYGDVENDFHPIPQFVYEMTHDYKELWEVAQKIENLVCRTGIHAGGVIFVDEDFTNSTALMRAPDGTIITQFDLHDAEDVSLIKYDILSVEALDKIQICLELLVQQGYITPGKTLKETYEKAVGIYNLEREDKRMWKMIWEHKITSLFQMEKQSGIQGIALTRPESVDDLATLNSVIRLMAQEKGAEQPLNKYARFKGDIRQWYDEMLQYGLTKQEQELLKSVIGQSYGLAESQERFMSLVQMPECGGFDLTWADKLRKAIAKKNPEAYIQLEEEYYKVVEEKGLSFNFCNYVWKVLIAMSRGYGFNLSHTLAYSLIALQEMNLAFKYPIIFWNCACLITDSGGLEQEEDEEAKKKSRNYGKIATAIGKMKAAGVEVTPPDINKSTYTFTPDVENNTIRYGLNGLNGIGEDIVQAIDANRPYNSIWDFLKKVNINRAQMVTLIKSGAFDRFKSRQELMVEYLWITCDKKSRLTLQNMPTLAKRGMLPEDTDAQILARRVYEFNRYLKTECKYNKELFRLDERSIDFLAELGIDLCMDENGLVSAKAWDKYYQKYMDTFREWMSANKESILKELNYNIFMEDWIKYATGNISSWEMSSLCFYYHEHELEHLNKLKYGISDFFSLPEHPVVDYIYKDRPIYKLHKICGTCIDKDKTKGLVYLLGVDGVITVKFPKDYYTIFDKQISVIQPDGTKKIVEKSWFSRGSMIMVQGVRKENTFIPKKYGNSQSHQLYHIDSIDENGEIILRHERVQGAMEDE